MNGLGKKSLKLLTALQSSGLTRKQCDEICANKIITLKEESLAKYCPHCKRWTASHNAKFRMPPESHYFW